MDSRIEELAVIILERSESFLKATQETSGPFDEMTIDKYKTYRNVMYASMEILQEIQDHRHRFIDLYR